MPSKSDESLACPPTLRDDFLIASVCVAMRVVVFATVTLFFGVSFSDYARRGDGESYVQVAEAMLGRTSYAALDVYHHRVFLGYPALMATVGLTGVPVAVAGLLITFLSAGGAAALAGRVFNDRRVGWASAMLVPHWVVNSSLVMTEAPALFLSLLGVRCAQSQRWAAAGAAFAAAGAVRPMTCFAAAGTLVALIYARQFRYALVVGATSLALFAGATVAGAAWRGAWFENARVYRDSPRAYGGELFALPGTSLLRESFSATTPAGRLIYVWAHVALVAVATVVLVARFARTGRPLDLLACVWSIGNTLFVLCIGSYWGFQHFPRFHILSQPPLAYALRGWLPRRTWVWLILAAGVTVFAVLGVKASP